MKITKSQLKRIIKEELESVVQEQGKVYDARPELTPIGLLLGQAASKMTDLQDNVFDKGYSNEQAILDLASEVYHVARLVKKAAAARG